MKRKLCMITMLIMSLQLSACGGSKPSATVEPTTTQETTVQETTTQETTTNDTAEKEQKIELHFDDTVEFGDYELSVDDFYFSDRANDPSGSSTALLATNDHFYITIVYNMKYKGKESVRFPYGFSSCVLDYDNGYEFKSGKEWLYSTSLNAWLNSDSIEPLSKQTKIAYNILVPNEVKDGNGTIEIRLDNKENTASFMLRPLSNEDIEAFHKKAVEFTKNGSLNAAKVRYDILSDYMDCSQDLAELEYANYLNANLKTNEKARDFFKEKMDGYTLLTGDEISKIFKDNVYGINTARVWKIYENGTIDDGFDYKKHGYGDFKRKWNISGDNLTISALNGNGKEEFTKYTVMKIDDNNYLLLVDNMPNAIMTIK